MVLDGQRFRFAQVNGKGFIREKGRLRTSYIYPTIATTIITEIMRIRSEESLSALETYPAFFMFLPQVIDILLIRYWREIKKKKKKNFFL